MQNRVNGPRRTTLVSHGCTVEMVEHILAALAGMKIDNCEVHVNRAEMPGFDGSSLEFVQALQSAGRIELDATRQVIRVTQPLRVGDDASWIVAEPSDTDEFEIEYHLQYDCPAIGSQVYETKVSVENFVQNIASARTFILESEAKLLKEKGLGQRVTYSDILVFNGVGPIDNELRFVDECARHKTLDMIGDFALAGTDLIGKFTAFRSGHRLNSRMVFQVLQQTKNYQKVRISA